ncbi:MAG: CerR family C-terminal domain-containing protein [Desulfurivibrionaceae bacterium]|nr:CerR family C-terminal domain-containing protein [Desulfurivibrionaceae bacterium]
MRKQRSDGQETRQNLLASAGEIFASKGFRDTTIAEICKQAAANTAAVSYHFGSKEALYVESWRYAFTRSLSIYPPDGGIPPEAPAEERLRGRILAIMRRIIDPQSHDFDIFHKEMASPTGLLAQAMQESVEQIFTGLTLLVCELLGAEPHAHEVQLCAMSIRAQCFGPLLHARCRKSAQGLPTTGVEPLLEDVEQLADHVTRFSLAGIRALRPQHPQQSNNEVGL